MNQKNYPLDKNQTKETLTDFAKLIKYSQFNDEKVMALSEKLGESLNSSRNGEGRSDTSTQIRKFYNLVKVAQNRVQNSENPQEVKIKLYTLRAQVAYAAARKTISPDFKEFFDTCLTKLLADTNLKKSINDFATFFEAFYAYFYFYNEQNKRRS